MPTWDHVIVGAGSAGAVVAARLAQDETSSVLVLEAGPDHTSAAAPAAIGGRNFYAALAEPARTWPDLVARRTSAAEPVPYARGRGVGGSSSVNAMLALEGEPGDYDTWRDRFGCQGWGWTDVAPVFGALAGGLRTADEPTPVDRALTLATGGDVELAHFTMTADGRRASSADMFLEPARALDNLVVRGDALADRVLFEGDRAAGLRLADGSEVTAGHVWICSGAIHSPAILLRSGLTRAGIGRNLKDHASTHVTLLLNDRGRLPDVDHLPFTVVRRFSSGAISHDLQMLPMGHLGVTQRGMLMLGLMQVNSEGAVTLVSDDPNADPAVDFAMFSSPGDLERLTEGVHELVRVVRHPAFVSICDEVVVDEAGTPPEAIDDEWLLSNPGSYVHAAGSCRMGRPDDPLAVVDSDGTVIGCEGLSVVDASILPDLPRANTYLPTLMVAERMMTRWRDNQRRSVR
ncbi:MAG: GMC oxidoreductase [Acidimicrobiales bacterium]